MDDEALRAAIAAHADAVHRAARRWTGNASAAAEVTALVFERARRESAPRRHVDRWLAAMNADALVARTVDPRSGDGFDDVRTAIAGLSAPERRSLARRLTGAEKYRQLIGLGLRRRLRPLMAPATDIAGRFAQWATHPLPGAPAVLYDDLDHRLASRSLLDSSADSRGIKQRTARKRWFALAMLVLISFGVGYAVTRADGDSTPETATSTTTPPSTSSTSGPAPPPGSTPSTDVTASTVALGGPAPIAPALTLQATCTASAAMLIWSRFEGAGFANYLVLGAAEGEPVYPRHRSSDGHPWWHASGRRLAATRPNASRRCRRFSSSPSISQAMSWLARRWVAASSSGERCDRAPCRLRRSARPRRRSADVRGGRRSRSGPWLPSCAA